MNNGSFSFSLLEIKLNMKESHYNETLTVMFEENSTQMTDLVTGLLSQYGMRSVVTDLLSAALAAATATVLITAWLGKQQKTIANWPLDWSLFNEHFQFQFQLQVDGATTYFLFPEDTKGNR